VNQFTIHPQSATGSGQNSHSMHLVNRQRAFSISFSRTFKEPKQLPFSQDGGSMLKAFDPNNLLAEHDSQTRSRSLSSTLGPECALSLLSSSLHHPSPTIGPAQVSSSLACFADATTAAAVRYASGVAHHAFVPDALLEDPSQALPLIWQ
jgi:hypothetical protein